MSKNTKNKMRNVNKEVTKSRKDNNPICAVLDIFVTILSYFFAYFLTNLVNTTGLTRTELMNNLERLNK